MSERLLIKRTGAELDHPSRKTTTHTQLQSPDPFHLPAYTRAWGDEVPPWLRLPFPSHTTIDQPIQRSAGKKREEVEQKDHILNDQTPTLQRKVVSATPLEENQLASRIQSARGAGHLLDEGTQHTLEQGLDADLSHLRIHTDAEADHLARSVSAIAFTTGADLFFRSGAYQPASTQGLHLLAHEATHAIQQATDPLANSISASCIDELVVSHPEDRFEQAAEANATRIIRERTTGQSMDRTLHTLPATPSATTTRPIVLQRAVGAKNPTAQRATPDNTDIPDLPKALVTQLQAACQSTASQTDRQKVLDDLLTYLRKENILDTDVTRIEYQTTINAYGQAYFEDITNPKNARTSIGISDKAFQAGAGVVYSTIRHEGIHSEQLKGLQNRPGVNMTTAPASTDAVFYSDRERDAQQNQPPKGKRKSTASGKGYLDFVIEAIQEIETHVWEIENASSTGAQQNTNFIKVRYEALDDWYKTLGTNARKLGPKQKTTWNDYVKRAKGDAERVLSPNLTTITTRKYKEELIPWLK